MNFGFFLSLLLTRTREYDFETEANTLCVIQRRGTQKSKKPSSTNVARFFPLCTASWSALIVNPFRPAYYVVNDFRVFAVVVTAVLHAKVYARAPV